MGLWNQDASAGHTAHEQSAAQCSALLMVERGLWNQDASAGHTAHGFNGAPHTSGLQVQLVQLARKARLLQRGLLGLLALRCRQGGLRTHHPSGVNGVAVGARGQPGQPLGPLSNRHLHVSHVSKLVTVAPGLCVIKLEKTTCTPAYASGRLVLLDFAI